MLDELNQIINSLQNISSQLASIQEPLDAIPEDKTKGVTDYYKDLIQEQADKLIALKDQV